jgi:hypothetical protein
MQVIHPVCWGIEGHPTQLTACLRRVGDDGTIQTAWRDFGTTYDQRLVLRAWLDEPGCPIVVLESTGVDWKPISHVLVERLEVVVAAGALGAPAAWEKDGHSRCRVAGGTLGPWSRRSKLSPAA